MSRIGIDPVSPGEILAEKLSEMNMSQAEFARLTKFSAKHVNLVINGKAGFSADAAIRFQRVTGMSARLWLHLQADYDLARASHS